MTHDSPTQANRFRAPRPYRLGLRRTTRAHLALARRPAFRSEASQALEAVRGAIAQQLGCPVAATARILECEVLPPRSLSETTAFALVELGARGARACVEVERAFLTAALERLSGGAGRMSPATRLTRIEEVAFGFLCLSALQALRACEAMERRFGPRLLTVVDARSEALARMDARQPHVCIEVGLTVGSAVGVARVLVPALALQAAIQDVPVQSETALAPELLAAMLPVTAMMGPTPIEWSELLGLSRGDVIVFDGIRLHQGAVCGPCTLLGPAFHLDGDLVPEGYQLTRGTSPALPKESFMSAPKPSDPTLTSIPVEVEVELTRLKLTLAELASLKPGAVFPLRINAAEPVTLRVGDRAVARAELVEIENEVGARILNLLPER